MKAVFLDRDGTITVGTPTIERVDSVDKVQLLPGTLAALTELAKLDYAIFIVTNQAGLAEKLIDWSEFEQINAKILALISPSGIEITETFVCPHIESDNCECRKPKPKLLLDAAQKYDIDLSQSWMIGDRESDVLCGVNAGAKGILVKTGKPTETALDATFVASTLLNAVRFVAGQ